ncbi:twin-arginine translocase TatA/TatE family subunit [Aestuariispira insulae]|uniref:Sec-independent protein translocase protein TatA n=1 Tax=Aestuariispira insulae TaxID=1461337 RepID=A0A3D9HNF7_9PROT|nr:twin-arginine translocase TatA/TatE family subunit [Aestuariispira insulae]RED51037.1 sec-independent protein translocase protein TatA [Aestuariispira insulae]
MGTFSIWHWLIVLAVVLILFGGKGKISSLMGDIGKGMKSFKKNIKDEAAADSADENKQIAAESSADASVDSKDKAANS